MDIEFKAKLSADSSTEANQNSSSTYNHDSKTKACVGYGWWGTSVGSEFNASYSSKKDSSATQKSKYSVEYTMDIRLNAGQGDMPAGLATVLNILQDSIEEITSPLSISGFPSKVKVDEAKSNGIDFYAIYDGNILKSGEITYVKITNGNEIGAKVSSPKITADDKDQFTVMLVNRDGNEEPKELKAGTAKFLASKHKDFKDAFAFSVELITT